MQGLVYRKKYNLLIISLFLLIIATILYVGYGHGKNTTAQKINNIERNLSSEISKLQRQVVPILESLEKTTQVQFANISSCAYPFFVFKNERLVYWSDYRFVPDYRYLKGDYSLKFIRTLRKDFLSRRWKVDGTDYEVFGLIYLHKDYKIDNNYVHSGYNEHIFSDQGLKVYGPKETKGNNIYLNEGHCLFKVDLADNYTEPIKVINIITAAFYILGIVLLISFFIKQAINIAHRDVDRGLVFLCISLFVLRLVMLLFDFPANFLEVPIFDSRYFASSSFNQSFADLYLNLLCVLILAIYIFSFFKRSKVMGYTKFHVKWIKNILLPILGGLLLLIFHFQYLIFQTIYHNSQISFDINQGIGFDANRILAFLIFITTTAVLFFLFHIIFQSMWLLARKRRLMFIGYILGAVLFSLINWLIGQTFVATLVITSLIFAVLIVTRLPKYVTNLRYNTFLYFFTMVIASALLGALAIHVFENEREVERKFKFASQFLIENDNMAEYLLSEVNENVRQDLFIQSRMSSPFLSKDVIKSKVRQVYLGNYFDKYDVQIFLYNANGQPFENAGNNLMPNEIKKFNVDNYKTGYDGIYFINKLGLNASKRYLDFIEIKKRGILVGYVIMDLNLKRIIPENVYPELLVDNRFLFPYQNSNYSYAVFSQGEATYHSGDFNYTIDFKNELLKNPKLYAGGLRFKNYRHLAVRDNQGRVVVISSNNHPWSNIISNFSFLFLIQVFALLVLTGGYALYFSFQQVTLNYSAKIQLYLNGAFFLPLFAVSITTLSVINSSFKKEVNEEYYKKAENITNNLSDDLNTFVKDIDADIEELRNQLSEVSKFSGVDVNLFNVRGKLLASSQPLIYENDLLSQYINPIAYGKIKEERENVFVTQESVGKLKYNTTFYGVKSFETGSLIGILSIPYFQSEYAMEQNQIDVLTNVINIFSVIFIIFLLISYLAAKWLTFPLVFITQKLKKTTLTGFNEPLNWNSDDEIGLMVGEYNRMLVNLEESKKALARSEKESAWREIAQQVAHEIKNPLTPMKLTLQHLSRRIKGTQADSEMEKPINSLLVQVEILNDIASSFSSFAKMPIPENEVYEFGAVLRNTVNLLANTGHTQIHLSMPDQVVYTRGDEQLMGRIISNIIINAIQAREKEQLNIRITLTIINSIKLLLEVKDNGTGIDEAIHSKIFIPNFSTKETGSGIGLAIAKHGVEHAGGKIWFDTEQGVGTSFFIELPIVPHAG